MSDSPARTRLRAKAGEFFEPGDLADAILALLKFIECISNARPACDRYRNRTGLICSPEFRGHSSHGVVEDAITGWLAEFFPNAEAQVTDLVDGVRPDIVLSYKRDSIGEDLLAIVEAKPVWQRWIATGEREYSGVSCDDHGRSTGGYAEKNIWQVVGDRDKLLSTYTDPRDRLILLALVFQRPGELDDRLSEAIGEGWSHRSRHIIDRCNPTGDNIGLTGMIFWRTI